MHDGTPALAPNVFLDRVMAALTDVGFERWTIHDIAAYANAGAEAIVNRRPDAFAEDVELYFGGSHDAKMDESYRVLLRVVGAAYGDQ